jgi:replicative DNA helicase
MPETRNFEELAFLLLTHFPSNLAVASLTMTPEFITHPGLKAIYVAMLSYYEETGKPPNQDVLKSIISKTNPKKKEDFCALIDHLYAMDCPESEAQHFHFYVQSLEEKWIEGQAKSTMLRATESIERGNPREAARILSEEIPPVLPEFTSSNLGNDFIKYLNSYEERQGHRDYYAGIKLGFPSLDQSTGGLHRGELAILVGGTGIGKSSVLGQVALNVTREGKSVLLVTVENSLEEYLVRLYSNISRVPHRRIRDLEMTGEEKKKLWQGISEFKQLDLTVVHFHNDCCVRDIANYLKAMKKRPHFLIVDQITNMVPNNQNEFKNMDWRWYSRIALELRRLSQCVYGTGLPVLTAIHAAGGTGDKKELTVDDTALSKMVQFHSYLSLYITRVEGEYTMGASKYTAGKVSPVYSAPETLKYSERSVPSSWVISRSMRAVKAGRCDAEEPISRRSR